MPSEFEWTDASVERLRSLWDDRHSIAEIPCCWPVGKPGFCFAVKAAYRAAHAATSIA
jgi:hypothetical protein